MKKEIRQLETALDELHKSNDVTRAAYSTLKFAVEQVKNCTISHVIKSVCGWTNDGYRPPCYMNKTVKCEDCIHSQTVL